MYVGKIVLLKTSIWLAYDMVQCVFTIAFPSQVMVNSEMKIQATFYILIAAAGHWGHHL